ncbi:sensor histidine kinase [Clostridium beijerinckii]|uniref:histidine kinase n=1 Tax=Clostridium beijerinckii TaxID=1520 RepID=A0A1S8SAZ1_CLOBE|nr:HAMP domain-containing sensor histidine kinase [Clostridium beijerinckii]NMF06763.1 HAMP domain-containing histidine kinase [Clostridium beijerinckii]NRY59331.1 signal transduction histidine kinase [Clostridium beijerinckii]OOM62643.1 alkaline phosphatase synthesis sensor protein PhoR [Clostridium beijerinckii]
MKFWEKIFISTLVVFEIFFLSASIYLINSNFKLNLNIGIDSGIREQERFCTSINSNISLFRIQKASGEYKTRLDKQNIDLMINTYLRNFREQGVCLDVIDESNNIIFANYQTDILGRRDELNTTLDKVNYIIRDLNGKTYLFVTREINLDQNYYKVSYGKDISSIYRNREYLINLFIKLNVVISIILIIVIIILSKIIVNPINKLMKSARVIAGGNFSERVKVASSDEVGLLAKNFNDMAAIVEEKINELEKISEDKQRFIDNLAHELRTPLTSIIGYADFLRTNRGYDGETLITSLSYIYDEGKRLEKLAFNLMELIVLKKEDFKMKEENMKTLLEEVHNSLIPKLEMNSIHLEVLVESLSLLIDRDLIKILITNLIDNAIKASKAGDKICISLYKDNKLNIVLKVKDMGIGIPKEDILKIFEPFFMVDKSRSRSNNGVGLGLSICAEIAKIHNATIDIESEINKGTSIKVIFNKANKEY